MWRTETASAAVSVRGVELPSPQRPEPRLCVSKSRYENRALHFEARNPRASPRCAPDEALRYRPHQW